MYLPCNTSQYIIKVLGCITGCIGMYSQMYWDVFGEVFWFMCRLGIHPNTAYNTSQYIVEYIIIPLKYIPIHLWCIEMLIHPKTIWYIHNTSQYIPIHRVHPPRFANVDIEALQCWCLISKHAASIAKKLRYRSDLVASILKCWTSTI